MPAREPRNNRPVTGFKGDPRSLDSSRPLTPLVPIVVEDLDQLKLAMEFELGKEGPWGLANALHEKFKVGCGVINTPNARRVVVNLATGDLQSWVTEEHHVLIPLEGAVTLYTVIEDAKDPTLFRLIIIGTRKATTFIFIREETAFTVDIGESSTTTLQAIANLYGTSLDKGVEGFDGIVQILPGLFYKLFAASTEDQCQIDFKVWHTKGEEVKLRLYLYPKEPSRNILSGNGYCWDVDLNKFPGAHIARGYMLRKWEERKQSSRG